jgi:hypothetical protein
VPAKGSAFERDICRRLSLWFSGGKRDDVYWRTSTSGGRATCRAKKGKSTFGQYGDICATHPKGAPLTRVIAFELKRGYKGKAVTLSDIVDRPPKKKDLWQDWLVQADTSKESSKAVAWMIVHKRDKREPVVWLDYSFIIALGKRSEYAAADMLSKHAPVTMTVQVDVPALRFKFIVVTLARFLEAVTPEVIVKIDRQRRAE